MASRSKASRELVRPRPDEREDDYFRRLYQQNVPMRSIPVQYLDQFIQYCKEEEEDEEEDQQQQQQQQEPSPPSHPDVASPALTSRQSHISGKVLDETIARYHLRYLRSSHKDMLQLYNRSFEEVAQANRDMATLLVALQNANSTKTQWSTQLFRSQISIHQMEAEMAKYDEAARSSEKPGTIRSQPTVPASDLVPSGSGPGQQERRRREEPPSQPTSHHVTRSQATSAPYFVPSERSFHQHQHHQHQHHQQQRQQQQQPTNRYNTRSRATSAAFDLSLLDI